MVWGGYGQARLLGPSQPAGDLEGQASPPLPCSLRRKGRSGWGQVPLNSVLEPQPMPRTTDTVGCHHIVPPLPASHPGRGPEKSSWGPLLATDAGHKYQPVPSPHTRTAGRQSLLSFLFLNLPSLFLFVYFAMLGLELRASHFLFGWWLKWSLADRDGKRSSPPPRCL
jgi:hypothetical protein